MNDIGRIILTVMTFQEEATGYTLTKDISEVWPVSHQQLYRELGNLTKAGFLKFDEIPQEGKPNKKCYRITASGLEKIDKINSDKIDMTNFQRSSSLAHVLGATNPEVLVKKLKQYLKELNKQKVTFQRMELAKKQHGQAMPMNHKRTQLLTNAEIEWVETVISKFDEV